MSARLTAREKKRKGWKVGHGNEKKWVGIYRSGTGKSVLSPFKNVPLLDTP